MLGRQLSTEQGKVVKRTYVCTFSESVTAWASSEAKHGENATKKW